MRTRKQILNRIKELEKERDLEMGAPNFNLLFGLDMESKLEELEWVLTHDPTSLLACILELLRQHWRYLVKRRV